MAVITVHMLRGAGAQTKRKLVQTLTLAVADVLQTPHTEVTVLIEEFAPENWAVGGELQSDRGKVETMAHDIEALFKKPEDKPAEKKATPKLAPKAPAQKAKAKSRSRR